MDRRAAASHFPWALTEAGLGHSATDTPGTPNCPSPAGQAPHGIISPVQHWHCLTCQPQRVCDDHRAAAALSYGIKCLENGLLSHVTGKHLPQPSVLPGMEVSGGKIPILSLAVLKNPNLLFLFFSPPKIHLLEEKSPNCCHHVKRFFTSL